MPMKYCPECGTRTKRERFADARERVELGRQPKKPKRKLSAWNKYVKANSKKPRFRWASGKLKLHAMAVAFRKTPAGKKTAAKTRKRR